MIPTSKLFLTTVLLTLISLIVLCVAPVYGTPGPPPPPQAIPIDGFASVILIAAGGAIGVKHLKDKFKQKKD